MRPQTPFWMLGVLMVDYYDIYEKLNFSKFSESKIFRRSELDLCRKSAVGQHRVTTGSPSVTLVAEFPVPMHKNASLRRKIFELEIFEKYIMFICS